MSQRHLLALYNNFDEAEAAIRELRETDIHGFNVADDLVIQSPIEHPEIENLLGEKPVFVQRYTLAGATLGGFLAFWLIAGSQANFYAQMKGGKPIVPIPPDLVLTYEMFILGGVFFTVMGFFICAGLPAKRSSLYSSKLTEGQIGVLVKCEENAMPTLKAILTKYKALEIQEEGHARERSD
jgi:hypothetical protein